MRASLLAVVLAAALGCGHTGSGATMAGAATMTSLAGVAAAVNVKNGGCVATCTNGTACNQKTGLCEVLPCRGRCGADEHCEDNFTGGRCVPGAGPTGVATKAPSSGTNLPVTGQGVLRPEDSDGPPRVVPAAEQNPPTNKDSK